MHTSKKTFLILVLCFISRPLLMGKLKSKSDYEALRNARVSENQARLALLGLHKALVDLRSAIPSGKQNKNQPKRSCQKKDHARVGPLRRSDRLRRSTVASAASLSRLTRLRRSKRLKDEGKIGDYRENGEDAESESDYEEAAMMTPAKGRSSGDVRQLELSPEDSARRCRSSASGRGSVYNSIVGICCHFCRQKTLCSEEDCKRCSNMDVEQPCIGKTDCSVCHSTNGVLCRACLKVRYGEEMEEVRNNKDWMCPHCIEEKGINSYWICNSSFCLKNRKLAPTGIAIYRARELGYKSVAHLIMDELKKKRKCGVC